MATLLELSDAINFLRQNLETEESPESREELIKNYFKCDKTNQSEINQKIDNYAALIRELELRSEARKGEAERILQRSKVDQNKAQYLKDRLLSVFKYFGLSSVETLRFRVTLAANGGKLPVQITCPVESLPSEYVKQIITLKPDLELIAEHLNCGVIIDGVSWGERGESIRIK